MGEGCGSWFPQQQFHWQSPNLISLAAPNTLGLQSTNPRFMNSGTDMVSATGTSPVYANPELHHFGVSQRNEPRGWFYCLPRFRQVFAPASNPLLKEQHLADRYENLKESGTSKAGTGAAEKRFLVFDQSGDQTTLIFSSAFGTHTKCLSSWGPKSPAADVSYDKGTDVQSEMHEDTEELNALLYSDDDSEYSEDEEVTSTGHSPSTMTAQDEQFEGGSEEVDSSTRLIKKRKLLDGSYGCLPLLMDTANSGNFNRYSEYEDDADSSCAKGQNPGSGDTDSSSSYKRMRKDKIRETVTVLRSIIPGGEGKDAVAVLDEAINYLKSLKLKAKTLGLNTL
ncbi:hypothetical protein E1A91_D05G237500v1 [Gossypium mustelinum]|uniref:BHLH domain-containing protein n=1 Tax=Gossypium mustelinum TaxID=34275 RepID=A0A5D2V0D0_GOSMU|nr:hypothetical protein E1A91_D05G237500v1 [Gossypium mustelinum]